MAESSLEFRDRLRAGVEQWGGAEWLADAVEGDFVTVLYRQRLRDRDEPVDLVEGARLSFERFASEVLGPGPHQIDDVIVEAILEIVEPHAIRERLEVR